VPLGRSTVVVADASELLSHLRERLTYDAEAGVFYRKAGFRGVVAGARVGCPESSGKLQATFLGVRHLVDRLVWLWETGTLPDGSLLHLDGDNGNDRFSNLARARKATVVPPHQRSRFLERVAAKFGTAIDTSGVDYQGAGKAVALVCATHGPFTRVPQRLLSSAYGCPKCCHEALVRNAKRTTPEQKRARQLAYQRAHPDIYRKAGRASRDRLKKADPERWAAILQKQNVIAKAWSKTDKGRAHASLHKQHRRMRLKAIPSIGVTPKQWKAICLAHSNDAGEVCCKYCKKACKPTIEHVVPIARGGRHEPSNVVPACRSCNSSKCDQLVGEWPKAATLLSVAEFDALVSHTRKHLQSRVDSAPPRADGSSDTVTISDG
jgi:5-methylcytosine-specific restriction endonuclease McrA